MSKEEAHVLEETFVWGVVSRARDDRGCVRARARTDQSATTSAANDRARIGADDCASGYRSPQTNGATKAN